MKFRNSQRINSNKKNETEIDLGKVRNNKNILMIEKIHIKKKKNTLMNQGNRNCI